jgi:SHS2 domain-containing protein
MRYEIEVVSDGPDFTSALVSMLNDILYLVDENRAIPVGFNVRGVHISPDKAEIKGAVILDDGWTASEEVKAVSYSLEWGLLMIFDV